MRRLGAMLARDLLTDLAVTVGRSCSSTTWIRDRRAQHRRDLVRETMSVPGFAVITTARRKFGRKPAGCRPTH
jgi:hypothetical protein